MKSRKIAFVCPHSIDDPVKESVEDPAEDSDEEKKRKRMKRNRESAALSRDRKKQHIEALELENASLRRKIDGLEADKALLETKLSEMDRRNEEQFAPFSNFSLSHQSLSAVVSLCASPILGATTCTDTLTDSSLDEWVSTV